MNKPKFALFLPGALLTMWSLGAGCASAQTAQTDIKAPAVDAAKSDVPQPTRSVVYKTTTDAKGEAVELKMNIFEPHGHKASDKTPVVAFFFGGGWNNGSPDFFFAHCQYFASRGLVAVAPDYRVKSRQNTTPFEAVADAKSAIRWVRAHATELGIAPDKIAAAGSSAGGHVAASAAIISDFDEKSEDAKISSAPNALVLYNAVVDTSDKGYGYGHWLLKNRWRELSPLQNVRADLPPTLIFHGNADKTVPYANAVAFEKAMKDAGNRVELVTLDGQGHGFAYDIQRKAGNDVLRQTDEFLVSLGYLQGEPTVPAPTK